MSTIGRLAAIQSAWDRWVRQALDGIREPSPPPRLTVLDGQDDDMHAPGPAHPAAKALRKRERK